MAKGAESRTLRSTADVLQVLGIPAVMAMTGARYKTVWQWGETETFPARTHAVMTWALRKKKLTAPPSLWGQVTIPEMEKAAA
jgi:hypothetical protein